MLKSSIRLRAGAESITDRFFLTYLISKTIVLIFILLITTSTAYSAHIVKLDIKGPIGPATVDYINRGITSAQKADLILVILDTPGGLDEATRLIMQKFLGSNVPVIVYVSPNGARAASAGTYLLYASTLAAMAPGTQLGAASPVQLGAGLLDNKKEGQGKNQTTMERKMTNDALATIRSLAQLRGRNSEFAQKAILNAASMTAPEALKAGVINYIATDEMDLLAKINGVSVTQNNRQIILNTTNPVIEQVNPDWRTRFLSIITNPSIAYLLILLGVYGIFFELLNPGFVLPGVIGAVSMLLALYALQLLPVNYTGLLLIILGIGFIVTEGLNPGYGILGVGGTIAFILGSIMLIETDVAIYKIAWPIIWAMAVVNIGFFVFLLGMVIKARRQKVNNGLAMLVGAKGRALGDINLEGQAVIRGEIWSVYSKVPISANKNIRVLLTRGLLLEVEED